MTKIYNEGDKVIISESIFAESTDPNDAKYRGAHGVVSLRMWEVMKGKDWQGCYQIDFSDGDFVYVKESEIRPDD
jgi:hypothetical protein